MLSERVEKLRQEYTGRYVEVDSRRPELARFAATPGVVKTINFNGRALVQFEGADKGWYDVELDYLKVVERHEAEPPRDAAAEADGTGQQRLSRLELARLEKAAGRNEQPPAEKPGS